MLRSSLSSFASGRTVTDGFDGGLRPPRPARRRRRGAPPRGVARAARAPTVPSRRPPRAGAVGRERGPGPRRGVTPTAPPRDPARGPSEGEVAAPRRTAGPRRRLVRRPARVSTRDRAAAARRTGRRPAAPDPARRLRLRLWSTSGSALGRALGPVSVWFRFRFWFRFWFWFWFWFRFRFGFRSGFGFGSALPLGRASASASALGRALGSVRL